MRKICRTYCGVACIDGTCPKANMDEYIERGYDAVRDCAECHYYRGCEDCYFNDNPEYACTQEKKGQYSG